MRKKISFSIMMMALMLLSSCSGKFEPTSDQFNVTPEVLVEKGGKVDANIEMNFPEKSFPKKYTVTITPILKYEGGEAVSESMTLQGEKVEDNNKIIYKAGGQASMKCSFDYVPEMAKSELFMRFTIKKGDKEIDAPDLKIADGVNSTEDMASDAAASANPALTPDEFQRIIKEKYDASIKFLIQQSNIRYSELKSDEIATMKAQLKEANKNDRREISEVKIQSYASPDGGVKLNEKVASNRENSTKKFINKEMKRAKVDGNVNAEFTSQDWAGFKDLVSKSDMQDKNLVLRVLSMYNDPEQREAEIKNLSSVYKSLAKDILPQLRRSKMELIIDVIGKSDEEIKTAYSEDPKSLNIEEILYAVSLEKNVNTQKDMYKTISKIYPNDERAFNNLGVIAFQEGKLDVAKKYFDKAYSINKSSDVNNNLALYTLATKGDLNDAEQYASAAADSKGLNETLGIIYTKEGKYDQAVKSFGSIKSNNAALAQILAKDYNKANTTLNGIENSNALTSYLKAIVSARTNNKDKAISNLADAIAKDSSFATKAAKDLEFAKYATDSKFLGLIK